MNSIYKLIAKDKNSDARLGVMRTAHGDVDTPAFMPVGTQATVKTTSPGELRQIGVDILLSNAYHLLIRPGIDLIKKQGGLHRFMGWDRPILTDSGGYQVFSLAKLQKVSEEGVRFNSHFDGRTLFLSPEDAVRNQTNLGVDIAMVLDECPPYPSSQETARRSLELTLRWARRSIRALEGLAGSPPRLPLLFGIVQGSTYPALRREAITRLVELGFSGIAMGGLSVGEPREVMLEVLAGSAHLLPEGQPRYLMGVGEVTDIVQSVGLGMDLFDCTIPTRLGRNGTAITSQGRLVVRNAEFSQDKRPLDETCKCTACLTFSRSYLRHLFNVDEILGPRMVSLHNLYYYMELMRSIRQSIREGSFGTFLRKTTMHTMQYERS